MTAHTPSPWYARETFVGQALIASETTGASVAVAYDAADGPLLAAAPELLSVLRDVASFWPDKLKTHPDVRMLLARVDVAIAKAEGR